MPALIVVAPLKVFAPVSVSVDVALVFLVSPPAPEMTPESVWLAEEESMNTAPVAMAMLPA